MEETRPQYTYDSFGNRLSEQPYGSGKSCFSVSWSCTGAGSSDNDSVTVSATDTANPTFATSSFQFDTSSTTGGANASSGGYAPIYAYTVPSGGYAPNSNLLAHSDTVMGDWAFQYDALNRLTAAAPAFNAPPALQNMIGCYGYDSFGNRTLAGVTSADCTGTNPATASYNPKNQVTWTSVNSAVNGFTYDSAGNVTFDGTNHYAYDAEGRLCAAENISGASNTYLYNAEGVRIAKANFSTSLFPALNTTCATTGAAPAATGGPATGFALTNQYLLDLGGDQVTELNGTGTWVHSNIWAGSHLNATYDSKGLHFHLSDPLGTRRVQTNPTGQVEETCQSLPFGDQLGCTPTSLATADDATEHHFTGKERDTESGLDYFGARYYASNMGRWMSPDWSAQAEPVPYAKLDNPQSLNLYDYVGNNPLRGVDPDGHDPAISLHVCSGAEQGAGLCSGGEVFVGQAKPGPEAQQQYGRQPDGSYKADPAKVQKAIDGGKSIGGGQCADLCKFLSGAPNTGSWVAGKHVADLTDADIGTAIATFDNTGHYPSDNDPLGKNSAIFMSRGAQGSIIVVDQWPADHGRTVPVPPFKHTILYYSPDNNVHPSRSDNADAYYVIRVP